MNLQIFAVEPQLDGSEHVFGPEYAHLMKLPFKHGWDHWRVYQGTEILFSSAVYRDCARMVQALGSIQLLNAA